MGGGVKSAGGADFPPSADRTYYNVGEMMKFDASSPGYAGLDGDGIKRMLDKVSDGFFVLAEESGDYRFLYWNGGAEKILGRPREEVLGRLCREGDNLCPEAFSGGSQCGTGKCIVGRALAGHIGGRLPHIVFFRDASGRPVPVSLTLDRMERLGEPPILACSFRETGEEYQQLLLAGEIQKRMVTTTPVAAGPLICDALFRPLELTGGDFLECFTTDCGLLVACSADATGHGISAALFAMIFKTLFHASIKETYSPGAMLALVNDAFCDMMTIEGYYLTATVVVLDPQTCEGYYASAGHPQSLVFGPGPSGAPEQRRALDAKGFMIGMVAGAEYEERKLALAPGEVLFIATDGVLEAADAEGRPFGRKGVETFMAALGCDADLDILYRELVERASPNELDDDVSVLRIRRQD